MYFDNMVLYYKPTCPFCHKVLAFMEQEDIAMPMRDTLEPGVKDDLIRIAGKGQVPCLIVDGVPMFESDDIIRFLGDLILEREVGLAAATDEAQDAPGPVSARPVLWKTSSKIVCH